MAARTFIPVAVVLLVLAPASPAATATIVPDEDLTPMQAKSCWPAGTRFPSLSEDIDTPDDTGCGGDGVVLDGAAKQAWFGLTEPPADLGSTTALSFRVRGKRRNSSPGSGSASLRKSDHTVLATCNITTTNDVWTTYAACNSASALTWSAVADLYIRVDENNCGCGGWSMGISTFNVDLTYTSNGNVAPAAPSSLAQFRSDGSTPISAGGWTNDGVSTDVVLSFSMQDGNAGQTLTPWVEIQPVPTAFSGKCGQASGSGGSRVLSGTPVAAPTANVPVTGTVNITGLTPDTTYRWRACVADQLGPRGGWTAKGSNPDFRIDTTAPNAPTVVNDGTGVDVAWTSSASTLQANWSGASDPGGSVASYDWCFNETADCTTTPLGAQTAQAGTTASAAGLTPTWRKEPWVIPARTFRGSALEVSAHRRPGADRAWASRCSAAASHPRGGARADR